MITPAHVQQVFAREHVVLRRFAQSPELCDSHAHMCAGMDMWGGGYTYLAETSPGTFMVVVMPTIRDARRLTPLQSALGRERRQNVVLFYIRSAKAKLRTELRAFARIPG